jgi:hypothetical protein
MLQESTKDIFMQDLNRQQRSVLIKGIDELAAEYDTLDVAVNNTRKDT